MIFKKEEGISGSQGITGKKMGAAESGPAYPADTLRRMGGLEKPCQTTKVLPLKNSVRITTGVKVASWGGRGRRLRRDEFCTGYVGIEMAVR